MAHAQKFSMGQVGRLMKHYERTTDGNGEHTQYGNIDIDTSKSHLNYNLAPKRESQYGFLQERLDQIYVYGRNGKRTDFNVMIDWAITQPKDFPEERSREFFEKSYEFLKDRYGEENVISANVHLDETTPHMHFAFVPVTYDNKRERYKLSAHEVINRGELKKFHPALKKYLEQHFEFEVSVVNGATAEGNKSIAELKRGTAQKELQKIKSDINVQKTEKETLETQINSLKKTLQRIMDINDDLDRSVAIEAKIKGFKKDKVEVDLKDLERIKKLASSNHVLKEQLASVTRRLEEKNQDEIKMKIDNNNLNSQVTTLTRELKESKQIIEGLADYLSKNYPEVYRELSETQVQERKTQMKVTDLEVEELI